jgi:hypothetical protein
MRSSPIRSQRATPHRGTLASLDLIRSAADTFRRTRRAACANGNLQRRGHDSMASYEQLSIAILILISGTLAPRGRSAAVSRGL